MKYSFLSVATGLTLLILLAGCDAMAPDLDTEPAVLAGETSAQVPSAPVRLTFEKEAVDPTDPGVWIGTVEGAFAGDLETVLLDLRVAGPIWHVVFDWIITDTEDDQFDLTARLDGTLNTNTGRVVMNGRVTDGYLEGARVHEEGQLVDPATLEFHGLINIMPRTAR